MADNKKSIKKKESKKLKQVTIPLLPLRDIVVFPHAIIPLFIGREISVKALDKAMAGDRIIMLATQRKAKKNDPLPEEIYNVGTIANVLQVLKQSDGTVKVLIEGTRRARIESFLENAKFFEVNAVPLECDLDNPVQATALMRSANSIFEQYAKLNQRIPPEMLNTLANMSDPDVFADTLSEQLNLKTSEKQELLEMHNPKVRLDKLIDAMVNELEIMRVEKKVRSRVKRQMEKSQKEYYLTEQIKAIHKELGKNDDLKTEIQELSEKIKKAGMPKEILAKAQKELKKLGLMPPMSAEATVVRNYIDWLVDIPWKPAEKDKININQAKKILDKDHYGLEKIKERILEYLSVRKLVDNMKGPILCFVGPPGVGKTSLGKSIARALDRKFVRVSLGGVRDEAEIRGHRRTYIGALPGKIIQYMKKAGSKNPVFMLDEVDKMSTDFRGDPSSALLEVLDPEQNNAFNDHYLEVDYDLSEVLFITTANLLHPIPQPLLDRMETLRISGYTEDEKIQIAKQFLIPKKIIEHGLKEKNIKFLRSAVKKIVQLYTREAGVRNLEREIAAICRKIAKEVATKGESIKLTVTPKRVQSFLGVPKFRYGKKEKTDKVGLATGLAWTEVGGELLVTEVAILDGTGKSTFTGQLGEVMQESAQAAVSYVRSKAKALNLPKNFYQKKDIHIHIPEGAIPKDGPSAGITIATAIVSALTKIPIRNDLAMTGEITLQGRVLPIGGLKEKLLAAHRGEISNVIIPLENKKDLSEIPQKIKKALKISVVENMDEVLNIALLTNPFENIHRDKEKLPSKTKIAGITEKQVPKTVPLN